MASLEERVGEAFEMGEQLTVIGKQTGGRRGGTRL